MDILQFLALILFIIALLEGMFLRLLIRAYKKEILSVKLLRGIIEERFGKDNDNI